MTVGRPPVGPAFGNAERRRPARPIAGPQTELLAQLPVAVVATRLDGTVTRWNRHAEELFGWQADRIVGRDAARLLALAIGRDRADEIVRSAIEGRPWDGELSFRRPDGSRLSVYITTAPLHDAEGTPVGALAVAVDITARVQAEEERAEALRREQGALAEAELLHRIATAASAEEDLFGILSAALDRLSRLIPFTGGSIALVDGDELVLRAAIGPFASGSLGQRLPRGSGQSWKIIDSGEPWLADDLVDAGYHIRGIPVENGPRSYLALPLVWQGRTVGLLQIDSVEPYAFRPEHRTLMEAVAVALSGPIELARRREAEREALERSESAQARLALLADATAVLSSSLDYETTLRHVTEVAAGVVADWCVVDVLEEGGRIRRLAVAQGDRANAESPQEVMGRTVPASLDADHPVAQVIRTGEPLLLPHVPAGIIRPAELDDGIAEQLEQVGWGSTMVVPLSARGRTVGAISLISTDAGRAYDAADLSFAVDLGRRAGAAVDTARLTSELAEFRSTVDLTHDGVFMFDPRTLRYFYANEGAVELTGYSHDELLAMTPLDLKPEYDERRFRDVLAPLIAGTSGSTMVTTTQRRKDARLITVEILMQHVQTGQQRGRIVAVVRDITDRIEARARLQRLAESERARNAELRAIIRAMGDAVMVVQTDGRISMTNPAADALFADSVSRYEELLARLEDPDSIAPQLASRERQGPVELRLRSPDRWLEISAYPVFAPSEPLSGEGQDRVLETILFMRDVTDQREARQMRDAFVGVLSHELRTPVTTIYGNSKLLGRDESQVDEPTRRDLFGDIEMESERLYRLVEDLLVLARFGEEESRLGREPLLLQRVLPIVVRSERGRWPSTTFTTQIEPGIPAVQGDPTYVEQVIRNLIGNAAKYSGEDGTVEVTLDTHEGGVRLRVVDDGPGFAADEAARLFDLFYRSPGTAAKASGAGIGLFVCRRLIETMGGRIWARPRSGQGAEFGFTLPVFSEEVE